MRVEDIHNRRERYTYYLQNSNGIEATNIREIESLIGQDGFSTKVYSGVKTSSAEQSNYEFSLPIGSFRNSNDELEVVRINNLSNALVVGPTGSGKSQGILRNTIMNCNGKETVIVIDIKGDICRDTYWAATKIWGAENTHVANFSEPKFSSIRINDMQELAKEWDEGRKLRGLARDSAWNEVLSKLRKILNETFPIPEQTKDISWYSVPRNQFWYPLIIGMLEDMSLTKTEEKKTGRIKTTPEMFNYTSICKIADEIQFSGGSYKNQVNDKGWFSKRSPNSEAYKKSYALLHNASSTLANYAGFIEEQKHMISNPKIQAINITNTLNVEKMTEVPGIYYIITDICDNELIDYTNKIMTQICRTLLERSHTNEETKGKVPVLLLMDEFPTICKNAPDVYPRLLTTGRGSGIYLHMYVQSLSQLRERYGNEYQTLKDNCNLFVFLGTNDVTTAKEFSDDIGRTSIIDQVAFAKGDFAFTTVSAITQDALLHRMKPGEAYIKLFEQMPIHTRFELFYKIPEFNKYFKKANKSDYIRDFQPIDLSPYIYNASWMRLNEGDDSDDDVDFFLIDESSKENDNTNTLNNEKSKESEDVASESDSDESDTPTEDEDSSNSELDKLLDEIFEFTKSLRSEEEFLKVKTVNDAKVYIARICKTREEAKEKSIELQIKAGNYEDATPTAEAFWGAYFEFDALSDKEYKSFRRKNI